MTGPLSDGACALLLASPEKAKQFGDRAVWISGMGNATDSYWTDRDLASADALGVAAKRAYKMAGIGPDQLDVAEISARYAHEELLYGEALGLWERNEMSALAQAQNGSGKRTRVNPSGGAISGNPTTVAGLTRAAEAYLQLSGRAGEHQVKGAKHALAHGTAGLCGQSQMVIVMRRGDA